MRRWTYAVIAALVGCLATSSAARAQDATQPQSGDLFVGGASYISFGATVGGVFLAHSGTPTLYCAPPNTSSFDPDFWKIPSSLIVDSQGRVVFLAPLGAYWQTGAIGLLRCSGPNNPVEKLAVFPAGTLSVDPLDWPVPFPNMTTAAADSLHILRDSSITDDFASLPKVNSEDAYEFLVTHADNTRELIRYSAGTNRWQNGQTLPQVLGQGNYVTSTIVHDGHYWSIGAGPANGYASAAMIARLANPLDLHASGSIAGVDFDVTVGLFGGLQLLPAPAAQILDSTIYQYQLSGCPDSTLQFIPTPFSDAYQILGDEWGGDGIVIRDGYGPTPGWMSNVTSELLNDNPLDDQYGFSQLPYPYCTTSPKIEVQTLAPTWTSNGLSNGSLGPAASTVNGIVASDYWGGQVLAIMDPAPVPVVTGIPYPEGVAGYPARVPSAGTTVYIGIHSPVDVLITDSQGRRIGVDPTTGQFVNDFAVDGFDSGPGEPRFFAIKNVAPGSFSLQKTDTGNGPYRIDIVAANLDTGVTSRATAEGTAVAGTVGSDTFVYGEDGSVQITSGPDADHTAPTISIQTPADGAVVAAGTTLDAAYSCQDEAGGSGVATCAGPVASGSPIDTSALGLHTFTVSASDHAGNMASASTSYTVVAATTTALGVSPTSSATSGQPVTLTASVAVVAPATGVVPGSVTFFDGTTPLGSAPLANGVATLTTSGLGVGDHTLSAQYGGDTDFTGSASTGVPYTITSSTPQLAIRTLLDTNLGNAVVFAVQVVDSRGANKSSATIPVVATGVRQTASGQMFPVDDVGHLYPGGGFRFEPLLRSYLYALDVDRLPRGDYELLLTVGGQPGYSIRFSVAARR